MVPAAEDYRWSSLRATLGFDRAPAWLAVHGVLASFGSRRRYLEFVRQGIEVSSPWTELRGSVLGSERFAQRLGWRLDEKVTEREIPRRERLLNREGLEDLFPPRVLGDRAIRNDRIREVSRTRGYSLVEISRHLGLHYSTVSRIVAAGR